MEINFFLIYHTNIVKKISTSAILLEVEAILASLGDVCSEYDLLQVAEYFLPLLLSLQGGA
jgi:hypothetical protein